MSDFRDVASWSALSSQRLSQFSEIPKLPEVEGMVSLLHVLAAEIKQVAQKDTEYTRYITRMALALPDTDPMGIAPPPDDDI
eukprot:7913788-Heterocapsa_arctica.AAC.1